LSVPSTLASRLTTRQRRLLALWVVALLIGYGLAFGGGYGISIDEPRHFKFAQQTLEIYQGRRAIDDTNVDPLQHGPFYSFVAFYAGQAVEAVRPGWTPADGRHFVYFLSFVMATVFVGLLARRYTRLAVAWLTAALFFTQPLLLGHAFINPKDIPFMAFFVGALTAGLCVLPGHHPSAVPTTSLDRV
jgi:hypothetical protein